MAKNKQNITRFTLTTVLSDLRIYMLSLKTQIKSEMSLRGAFAIQVLGMMINNSALVLAWLFFFNHFGTLNGWHYQELIGMMGIDMLVYGIVMVLSFGILDLPTHVDRGSLDTFLTKPQPILSQLATSALDVTTFGDILLGLALTIWYISLNPVNILTMLLFILAIIIGMVAFWCFGIVLPNLISFYVFDSERFSRYAAALIMDVGTFPSGVLTGPLRTFLLVGIPGLLMGAVPLEVVRSFGIKELLIGIAVATFWLIVTLKLFNHSIKRYESSNLIGAR